MSPILLVAHGSSYPRAAATTRALARAVAAARPGGCVEASFLDHAGPRPDEVLATFRDAGFTSATVVPLLLTSAYHGRVDIPAVLAKARAEGVDLAVRLTDVLGPVDGRVPAPLLAGLHRRLVETGASFDAVVLAAAGTRDRAALATIELAARTLGHRLGVPCLPAYASASAPTAGEAVYALRARGARSVAVAAYFLAPGRLYDAAVESARTAGAVTAAQPLGAVPDLVRLVLDRVAAPASAPATAA
ncbi:sirohydrochlorin chelatase [Planosporangium flavigriseum]|uniref:Sirohydrochlorin chelatase n=1 Tax=Planosporangium flavigriseum TaxID=373681 RepID=A0A8J3LWG9_9ACTN|nr:sirohydrochlorin chelatase [Planosporangium flavigriseum]